MPRALLPIMAVLASSSAESVRSTPSPIIGYATVRGWNIHVDMEHGHSCHIVGSYASGTIVSFGVDSRPGDRAGYLVVANPAWKGFDDGGTYSVIARYAGGGSWKGRAKASIVEDTTALTLRFADPFFAQRFAKSRALTIVHAGRRLARLDLTSSGQAVKAMISCQDEVDGLLGGMEDGNAEGQPTTGDQGEVMSQKSEFPLTIFLKGPRTNVWSFLGLDGSRIATEDFVPGA